MKPRTDKNEHTTRIEIDAQLELAGWAAVELRRRVDQRIRPYI